MNATMPDLDRYKRLSLGQIVALLLTRTQGERSSISLTRNAKGVTQIDVTVRTGDTEGVTTALEAEQHAVAIYNRLRSTYPLPSGHVGAEGEPQPAAAAPQ
jgi:hypothetical protein